jgi:hypothetical protein
MHYMSTRQCSKVIKTSNKTYKLRRRTLKPPCVRGVDGWVCCVTVFRRGRRFVAPARCAQPRCAHFVGVSLRRSVLFSCPQIRLDVFKAHLYAASDGTHFLHVHRVNRIFRRSCCFLQIRQTNSLARLVAQQTDSLTASDHRSAQGAMARTEETLRADNLSPDTCSLPCCF